MKAVIMAGGKGTRLRPLTSNTPKPMVPLLDKPVMEYTIKLLKQHGITDIAVTVQFIPEVIRNYFGDGSDFGVNLHYFEENTPLGTAGSVKNAEDFLDETFIVISGDALTDFDLSQAIAYHKQKQSTATLVLTQVDNPLEFGVVMTDPSGQINRFLEKPSWGEVFSDTINTGIYILETEIFQYFERNQEFDFSKDLFPLLMKNNRPMYGFVAKGYWSDIGNLQQYRQTQFDMLEGKVQVSLPGQQIAPNVWVGDHVTIDPSASIVGPAYIGSHCSIGREAKISYYTVVGSGSVIKDHAQLERTVLWNNNLVDKAVEINGATLCRNVVASYSASIHDGAVVGDHCRIGVRSVIQPGIKVFPGKMIEDDVVLKQSLIWGERAAKNLFGQFGVKGTCNVDMTTNFANRLSIAFASAIPEGSVVGIGHDAAPFAELIAEAFAFGLHASGVNTYQYGAVTSSVTRYASCHLDCTAGIYIRMAEEGKEDQIVIEFLDDQGLPITKAMERKIENAYYQEDSRVIKAHKVGRRKPSPQVRNLYRDDLLRFADAELISNKGYKMVIVNDGQNLTQILPDFLHTLGCKVIQLNDVVSSAAELSRWVHANGADFGVIIDKNGQHIELVTDKGEVVSEEHLNILQIMIQLQMTTEDEIRVPVNFPNIVETLVTESNRRVVRSKADVRSVLEGCQNRGYHVFLDGLYTLVHIMQMMACKDKSLSGLVQTIPSFTLLKERVECPWNEKGKVMRSLMEETKDQQVELIDGIKIFHEKGWTLILPDNEEPVFQVFANSESQQAAKELAAAYAQKIQQYRNG